MLSCRRSGLILASLLAAGAIAGCSSSSTGTSGTSGTSGTTGTGSASSGSTSASASTFSTTSSVASAPSGPVSSSVSDAATGGAPAGSAPSLAPTVPAPTVSPAAAVAPLLMLEPDGLGALVSAASIRQLPFGSTRLSTVSTALAATLGGRPRRSTSSECGQGPRTTLGRSGFSALFNGTTFVGWTDTGRTVRRLTSGNGIGVGSTLTQLRKAFGPVTVTTDTLGPEFTFSSGLGGLLDGTSGASKITTLYAGETCFFR
jgi:hypothetical protein